MARRKIYRQLWRNPCSRVVRKGRMLVMSF
jgi:hypothetical protein